MKLFYSTLFREKCRAGIFFRFTGRKKRIVLERKISEGIADFEKSITFASLLAAVALESATKTRKSNTDKEKRAHSSAGLEHLSYKQRVIGSNPIGPTHRENGGMVLNLKTRHLWPQRRGSLYLS